MDLFWKQWGKTVILWIQKLSFNILFWSLFMENDWIAFGIYTCKLPHNNILHLKVTQYYSEK